jgi:hypothetical protein
VQYALVDARADDSSGQTAAVPYRLVATHKIETVEERRRRGLEAVDRLRELRRESMAVLDAVSLIRAVRDEADEEPPGRRRQ